MKVCSVLIKEVSLGKVVVDDRANDVAHDPIRSFAFFVASL